MGWYYPYHTHTRKDLIAELIKGWDNEKTTARSISHCTRGNVLWIVWEIESKPTKTTTRHILCMLMQKYNTWGYKDMDESMHPYYYSCPLKYLDMVPVASEEWRAGVQHWHEKQKQARRLRKQNNY